MAGLKRPNNQAGLGVPGPVNTPVKKPFWSKWGKGLAWFIGICTLAHLFLGDNTEPEIKRQPSYKIRNTDTAPVPPQSLRSTTPPAPTVVAPPVVADPAAVAEAPARAPVTEAAATVPAALVGEPTTEDRKNAFAAIFAKLQADHPDLDVPQELFDRAVEAVGAGSALNPLYTSAEHRTRQGIHMSIAAMTRDGQVKAIACFRDKNHQVKDIFHVTAMPTSEITTTPYKGTYNVIVSNKMNHQRKGGGTTAYSDLDLKEFAGKGADCFRAIKTIDRANVGTGETADIGRPMIGNSPSGYPYTEYRKNRGYNNSLN